MFTFSFSSAFAATTNAIQNYDLATARTQALNTVNGYANLADYSVYGQELILDQLKLLNGVSSSATANNSIALATSYATITSLVSLYKDYVNDTLSQYKLTDGRSAYEKYNTQYKAYLTLIQAITGWTDSDLATYGIGADLGNSFLVFPKTEAEAVAIYEKAIAKVNTYAELWNEGSVKTTTTKATEDVKAYYTSLIADYAVNNADSTAEYLELKTLADEAAAKIASAETLDQVYDIYDEYLNNGSGATTYATSTTKGVYKQNKAKALMTAVDDKYKALGYANETEANLAAWDEAAAWLAENFNAKEVYAEDTASYTNAQNFVQLVNEIAALTSTKVTSDGYVDVTKATTTTLKNEYELEATRSDLVVDMVKAAYRALLNVTCEDATSNSLTYQFDELYGNYSARYIGADAFAYEDAVETYEDAAEAAFTVADLRAAQEAFVAAVKDLKTYQALNFDIAKQNATEKLAALATTYAGYGYSPDVQYAIDFLTTEVTNAIAAKKVTDITELTSVAYDGDFGITATTAYTLLENIYKCCAHLDTVYSAEKLPATGTSVFDDKDTNNALLDGLKAYVADKLIGAKGAVPSARVATSGDLWDTGFEATVTNYVNVNGVNYANNYVEGALEDFFGDSYDSATDLLLGYNYALAAAKNKDFTTVAAKEEADLWTAFDKAVAGLGKSTTWAGKNAEATALENAIELVTTATSYNYNASAVANTAAENEKVANAAKALADFEYALAYEMYYKNAGIQYTGVLDSIKAYKDANSVKTEYGKLPEGTFTPADVKAEATAYKAFEKAIKTAKTVAEIEAASNAYIELVVGLVPVAAVTDPADYALEVSALKTLAAQYFAQYEAKVFTSAASTKEALRDDVLAGQGASVIADKKVTTKKTAKGIQVTCEQVANATTYKFWRATSLNGTYKLMFTKTTAEYKEPWTYTNTAVKKGTKYYYKVTVVVNGVESELSTHTGVRTW